MSQRNDRLLPEQREISRAFFRLLRQLTDAQRARCFEELMGQYCMYCGSPDRCKCEEEDDDR